ncbi:hypothetical protein KJ680_14375, partial [bacterium]|nr:hypothetical protein [bacterium]
YFAPITIEEIAEDIPIEQTMPFHRLLVQYNEFCEEHFEVMDILESQSKFRSFYDFVLANALAGNIIVKRMHINTFINKLTDLQTKYNQNLKSVDIYYDEIVEKVYHPQ